MQHPNPSKKQCAESQPGRDIRSDIDRAAAVIDRRLMLNGVDLIADPSGAILWPEKRTIVVADLHLEKGSAFARRGSFLPPYDTRATLDRLAVLIRAAKPDHMICLGDSFHDQEAAARISPEDQQLLKKLTSSCKWTWICGNHDPQPPQTWGGVADSELTIGVLTFRHEAILDRAAGELSGHFHPKFGLSIRGRQVSGRCFAHDGRRIVLPAFGAYAGGLDVRDPAISGLFPDGFGVELIWRDHLHGFRLS